MALRRAVLAGQSLAPATFTQSLVSCQRAQRSFTSALLGQNSFSQRGSNECDRVRFLVDGTFIGEVIASGAKHRPGTSRVRAVTCSARTLAQTPRAEGAASQAASLVKGLEPDYEGEVSKQMKGERLDAFLVANLPQVSSLLLKRATGMNR